MTDSSVAQFLEYLTNTRKVDLSKVTVKKTDGAGYGLFSTTDFKPDANEVMATIPADLIVTATTALSYLKENNKPLYNELSQLPENSSTFERYCINLFLINEKNTPTSYKFYMDILPSLDTLKSSHTLFFKDEYMELLEGTSLYNSIQARRESAVNELEQLKALVPSANDISLDDWQWADTVFWTRVVSIKSQKQANEHTNGDEQNIDYALVPLLDFANHSNSPNLRWEMDAEGNFLLLGYVEPTEEGSTLTVSQSTSGKKGEELFFSYGKKSNQELFFLHGFCIVPNDTTPKFTLSAIPLGMMDEETIEFKMKWLRQLGASHTMTLEAKPQGENHPLLKAGMTAHSVALLTLYVLDSDDPIDFDANDENITVKFDGKPQSDLSELLDHANRHNMSPMYQLRTVLMVCPMLEYHQERIASLMDGLLNEEDAHARDHTIENILVYATEELKLLENALTILYEAQDELGTNPIILDYISQSQPAEED
jgi:hypothetical protein